MKCKDSFSKYRLSVGIGLLASFVFYLPMQTLAQTAGNPVSYNSTPALAPSTAYVDASVFSGSDICARIYSALTASTTPSTGVVIDARGINSSSLLTCSSTETPWVSGSSNTTKPATILLPAGTITIGQEWTLPNETRIVGEGPSKTTIQVASGYTQGVIIYMGSSTTCPSGICRGVQVVDLAVSGNGVKILRGIENASSEDFSFVRNVSITVANDYGLFVSGLGQWSGPYSDISIAESSSDASTTCVFVGAPLRGIRGLTCTATGTTGAYGVDLDVGGNTLEDVQIQGFGDGVYIEAGPSGVNLVNIAGGSGVTNVIHLSNLQSLPTDINILGVSTQGATNSIKDDAPGGTTLTDKQVAMYVLGEPVTSGGTTVGYTRFTTSLNMPTWAAIGNSGTGSPTGSCVSGSIITNSAGVLGSPGTYHTMWVCTGGSWSVVPI